MSSTGQLRKSGPGRLPAGAVARLGSLCGSAAIRLKRPVGPQTHPPNAHPTSSHDVDLPRGWKASLPPQSWNLACRPCTDLGQPTLGTVADRCREPLSPCITVPAVTPGSDRAGESPLRGSHWPRSALCLGSRGFRLRRSVARQGLEAQDESGRESYRAIGPPSGRVLVPSEGSGGMRSE
jgi:hypothetical protein